MAQPATALSAKIGLLNTQQDQKKTRTGVQFQRYFTARLEPGKTPYDEVAWEMRTASIGNDKGAVIFEQRDVEVPADWSQTATNIVVSKYFYGKIGSPERETSVRQLVHRVVDTIADWGAERATSRPPRTRENFRDELAHLMLTQKACFNSPVWFNVGVQEPRGYGWYYDEATDAGQEAGSGQTRPQCSACFINSVRDSLESILDLAKTEGMLFKWGSGTGSNLSTLREEDGILSGGGRASGPLSLHEGLRRLRRRDQDRRQDAARGEDGDPQRRPSRHRRLHLVQGQGREEGPHADRRRLRFLARRRRLQLHLLPERQQHRARHRRVHGSRGRTTATGGPSRVLTGQPVKRYKARDLMHQIAEATHQCGDPGMQFDTTVNRWHTCKNTARINASNPCSEYMFLDDSACNLASLNLMKFVGRTASSTSKRSATPWTR